MPAFRNNARLVRALALLAAAGATALSAGCYYEGGPLRSVDRFAYVSTSWQPKTVSLVDTRTGETMWSVDIPVGRKLVIDFNTPDGANNADEWLPDEARWDMMPDKQNFGPLANKMRVPPKTARRLDVALRPVPEMPSGTPTASAPMAAPEQPGE